MNETKILGLKVLYNNDEIHVFKSYQLNSKETIYKFLDKFFAKDEFNHVSKPGFLIYEEWKLKNKLYNFNIFKKRNENYIITNKIHILPFIKCFICNNRKVLMQWKKARIIKK